MPGPRPRDYPYPLPAFWSWGEPALFCWPMFRVDIAGCVLFVRTQSAASALQCALWELRDFGPDLMLRSTIHVRKAKDAPDV